MAEVVVGRIDDEDESNVLMASSTAGLERTSSSEYGSGAGESGENNVEAVVTWEMYMESL